MKVATQCERVKDYLESGKKLTRKIAYLELGIMNPTARIAELRSGGLPIKTKDKIVFNRWEKKCRVAEWYLPEDDS